MGLHTHLKDYATPVQPRCASFYKSKALVGLDMRMYNAVQMTQSCVNVFFGRLTMNTFSILNTVINHIGFRVGVCNSPKLLSKGPRHLAASFALLNLLRNCHSLLLFECMDLGSVCLTEHLDPSLGSSLCGGPR